MLVNQQSFYNLTLNNKGIKSDKVTLLLKMW